VLKSEKNCEKCTEKWEKRTETVEKFGKFCTPPAHLIEICCRPQSHQDIRLRQSFGETSKEKLGADYPS